MIKGKIGILWVLFALGFLGSNPAWVLNVQDPKYKEQKEDIQVVLDTSDTICRDEELSKLFLEKTRKWQNYKYACRISRANKLCKLGAVIIPISLGMATFISRHYNSACWEFWCPEASNLTHFDNPDPDCLERFISKACALWGAHCQDTFGNFSKAYVNWNVSCQNQAQALSNFLLKIFAGSLVPSTFAVFVGFDDLCHKPDFSLDKEEVIKSFHDVRNKVSRRKAAIERGLFEGTEWPTDIMTIIFFYTDIQYIGDTGFLDSLVPQLSED